MLGPESGSCRHSRLVSVFVSFAVARLRSGTATESLDEHEADPDDLG